MSLPESSLALLIAFNFPPSGAVGTQRVMRFAKYLPEFGWRVAAVAPRPGQLDDAVAGVVLPDGERFPVRRARVLRPLRSAVEARNWLRALRRPAATRPTSNTGKDASSPGGTTGWTTWVNTWVDPWFGTPDEEVGWCVDGVRQGLRAIRDYSPRVLYTTGPPHSTHLIGLCLSRLRGIPWVADFRDPWATRPWATYGQKRGTRQRVQEHLERAVIGRASALVFNTDQMAVDFAGRYPEARKRMRGITNGYDPDDLPGAVIATGPPSARLTLTHAGSLYRRRTPMPLLRAVVKLRETGLVSDDELHVRLVGSMDPVFGADRYVEEHRLRPMVTVTPPVSRAESLEAVAASHVLLIIQPDTRVQVPGKLFEFLPYRRPILALAEPDGATADIVRRHALGWVANPHSDEDVADTLLHIVRRHREGNLGPVDVSSALLAFDGRRLTGELAGVFHEVARHGP